MAAPRVAINGFGRIGRAVFRLLAARDDIKVAAINDITPNETLAYLTRFDTVFGRFPGKVTLTGDTMTAGTQTVRMLEQREPAKLPWKELGIDVVVDSPGGLIGPKGMDPAVVAVLADAFRAAAQEPEHLKFLENMDQPLILLDGPAYKAAMARTYEEEKELLRRLNLLPA